MRSTRGSIVRSLLILLVLAGWLGIGAVGGQAQGKLSSVQENDSAAFLPSSAESTRAAAENEDFVQDPSVPALIVFTADNGGPLGERFGAIAAFAETLPEIPLTGARADEPGMIGDVLTTDPIPVPSEDGLAGMIVLPLDGDSLDEPLGSDEDRTVNVLVEDLRAEVSETFEGSGLTGLVTGPVGFIADLVNAFGGIDTVLLLVALVAVLAILAVVYRSPVLPFVVILTAVFGLTLAGLFVFKLAQGGALTLNGQAQGIMSILVVGASVDYALLLVARYREELNRIESPPAAMRRALRTSFAPIAASAGTVIAGLACLLLSDLASNRSLGPVGVIAIVSAFLAAMTFLPAALLLPGKRARGMFWPHTPHFAAGLDPVRTKAHVSAKDAQEEVEPQQPVARMDAAGVTPAGQQVGRHGISEGEEATPLWSRLARFVGKHDRKVWVGTAGALVALSAFVPVFNASGTGQAEIFLTDVDAVAGEEVLTEHFPSGAVQPGFVILPAADQDAALARIRDVPGVDTARVVHADAGAAPGSTTDPDAATLELDGRVRLDVVTSEGADTVAGVEVIGEVREAAHAVSPDALVGGAAAEAFDTQEAGARDLRVIVPIVLVVILGILMVLLRAILAPVLIMVANVLSFGAAMGVAALVFRFVFGFPGADPTVPLYAFCFLIALGVDYTIFLMTRVREETLLVGTRQGALRGLRVTGSVITSAGVVLAATFAALGVIPLLFLAQLAFIVSFGVLLDTLVVRSLLVPALIHDIGRKVWWPSKLSV